MLNLGLMNLAIVTIERFHHLYLPNDYSGSPTASLYTLWTEAEVLAHLATGWGEGAISNLKLECLYGPEPEVSGSDTVKGSGSYIVL
jgi:hypothetical protein